ncbi:uncharacterized protein LOC121940106 [Plectropomus leopardus]|uniref:uncharacterized protein LOC121940106 n=1 Tax=Plectropomus leopardus TaxID=160734 RepID=UPI001C4C8ACC|nr:uncharacterized protein LOC121940106 [Plectropomus leopardus]
MAMNTNTSLKYEEIISKSDLIQSGSPDVYQLKPKKENIGTLTRMTVGEKNPNKINKTILFVGETGTGKSTLINALVNYAMGVKWEDDIWFQIVEDEKKSQSKSQTADVTEGEKKSQSKSQTADVIAYEIFGFEGKTLPYSLTIINTPGYGDTRGTEHDIIVSERLLDLFRSDDGVHEVDAVGLVIKASENQLNDRLTYIFNSVVSLFGKDMEKNIVALFTHSNGVTPENVLKALEAANIKCAKDENKTIHFMFDNCQSTWRTKKNKLSLKHAWALTEEQMGEFTGFLKESSPQNLTAIVEVLKSHIRLTACIHKLQERIEFIDLKQEEIQQTEEALKKYEAEMKNNENFTVEVNEVFKVKEPVSEWRWWAFGLNYGGAVCCTVCKENCHDPCTLAWYPEHCEVMVRKCTKCQGECRESGHVKELSCTVCTGKCPVSAHVKEKQCTACEDECCVPHHVKGKQCPVCEGKTNESDHVKTMWRYAMKTRKVQKTKQDIIDKYYKGKAGCDQSTSLLETLLKKKEELEKEKDQLLKESFQHVVKLEQMALNVNSVSTYVHLDVLIEKMNDKEETEKVQRLEEMKRRMDEDKGTKAASWYSFGRIKAAGKAASKAAGKAAGKAVGKAAVGAFKRAKK